MVSGSPHASVSTVLVELVEVDVVIVDVVIVVLVVVHPPFPCRQQ
jgi:hypothetical protein